MLPVVLAPRLVPLRQLERSMFRAKAPESHLHPTNDGDAGREAVCVQSCFNRMRTIKSHIPAWGQLDIGGAVDQDVHDLAAPFGKRITSSTN